MQQHLQATPVNSSSTPATHAHNATRQQLSNRGLQRPVHRPLPPKQQQQQQHAQDIIPLLQLSSLAPELQQLVLQRHKQHQQKQQQQKQLLADPPHPLCHLNPASLAKRIKQCGSWRDAAVLFAQQAPCMNHIHLSALLVQLAHLPQPPSSRPVNWASLVDQVLSLSQPLLQQAEPRQLSNMVWALAKLGHHGWSSGLMLSRAATAPAVTAFDSASSSTSGAFDSSSSNSSSSRSRGGVGSAVDSSSSHSSIAGQWGRAWQQQLLHTLPAASCRDVSNVLWALAVSESATAASLATARKAAQQDSSSSSMGGWGPLCSAGHLQQQWQQQQWQQQQQEWQQQQQQCKPPSSRLLQEMLSALHRTLPRSAPQDVSNALWALAALQLHQPPQELLNFLLIRVQAHFDDLKPQEVANCLWALSQLHVAVPSSWLQECLLRQLGRGTQWKDTYPQNWVMCLMACAHMRQVPPTPWITQFLLQMQQHMEQVLLLTQQQQQQESNGCQSPPAFSCNTSSTSSNISSRSSSSHTSSSTSTTSSSSSSRAPKPRPLNSQDLCNTIWALGRLRVLPNAAWMQQFLAVSEGALAAAAPQELVNVMWGLQVLHVVPPVPWLAAFDAASMACMCRFTPQGLGDILATQVRLGLQPSPAWCEAWASALKASWGSVDAPAVCKTLWAAAKAQLPLGRAWLTGALARVHKPLLLPALAEGRVSSEDLLRLVWAVGRLCKGLLTQELSDLLGLYCCRAAGRMTGGQLTRGAWGLARLVPLPQDRLLSYFHDLAASKVQYMGQEEGGELQQRLALLRHAVANQECLGRNWRLVLSGQQQQQQQQQLLFGQQQQQRLVVQSGAGSYAVPPHQAGDHCSQQNMSLDFEAVREALVV